MSGSSGADVVVVGGGVIGLAVAWRARQRGLDVTVFDPAPGHGASWAAAGMLAPVTEVHYGEEALLRLNLASAERYPSFAAELEDVAGAPVGYRPCGTLAVAADRDDLAVLDDLHAFQQKLGLASERASSRECRRLEPALAPGIRGGLFVAGDHQVDNRLLGSALLAACERTGVRVERADVERIDVDGSTVTGVTVAGRAVPAGHVVLAAGCRSAHLPGLPPEAVPPVRPVKGQIVRVQAPADPPLLAHNVRGIVRGSHVYLVPRSTGRIVIGATAEEQGFDTTVTVGGVYTLLRDASDLIPDIAECGLVETRAGLRPGSPDNAPLIGAGALGRLVVATGHYRNGVLLTPVTADAVAALLADGEAGELVAPFSPLRFAPEAVA